MAMTNTESIIELTDLLTDDFGKIIEEFFWLLDVSDFSILCMEYYYYTSS